MAMSKTKAGKYISDGLVYVYLENDYLQVVFIPEIGGKMTTLLSKESGRQFLLEPQNLDKKYHQAYYGANFETYDTSGFDECFPTVEACGYPARINNQEISFPDHGELWSRPWAYEIIGEELLLSTSGVNFPYRFEKRMRLLNREIELEYSLRNLSDQEFYYIWSAHPLLKVEPGTRLFTADPIDQVFLNWASDRNIGDFGQMLSWPVIQVNGHSIDCSVVHDRKQGIALKCFTNRLKKGLAGVYFSQSDQSLIYQFDIRQNPYLGMWLCYGGWPENRREKHLTVAMEPASGRPDSLAKAVERNEYSRIGGKEIKNWYFKIKIEKGVPENRMK